MHGETRERESNWWSVQKMESPSCFNGRMLEPSDLLEPPSGNASDGHELADLCAATADLTIPFGPSDLLAPPSEDEGAPSARELANVLRRASNALARARHGPAAAPAPSAANALCAIVPSASAEAIEAERLRVRAARDAFPDSGWKTSAPAFRMPATARASPSGTWEHQEAARHRPRPASASPAAIRAATVAPAIGRPLRPVERPNSAAVPRRKPPPSVPENSDLSGPDPWWDRLNAAKTGHLLLSESEAARARTAGCAPPAAPALVSQHEIPSHGCWIRLSEQQRSAPARRVDAARGGQPPPPPGVGLGAGLGYRQAQPPARNHTPRTFGTAPRASPSGTWAHQAAVGNNAHRRARGEQPGRGVEPHDYGSFLPLQPLLEVAGTRQRSDK